ncbi:hypothetical protein Mapa_004231 [Marchantia paleacea]|nr:hypothetical protein Mapa_004231 [Marchantia paleacea]
MIMNELMLVNVDTRVAGLTLVEDMKETGRIVPTLPGKWYTGVSEAAIASAPRMKCLSCEIDLGLAKTEEARGS